MVEGVTVLKPFFEGLRAPLLSLVKSIQPEELDEFRDGAKELFHRQVDILFRADAGPSAADDFLRELIAFAQSWALSMRLSANAEWIGQMDESRDARVEPPLGFEDLKARINA